MKFLLAYTLAILLLTFCFMASYSLLWAMQAVFSESEIRLALGSLTVGILVVSGMNAALAGIYSVPFIGLTRLFFSTNRYVRLIPGLVAAAVVIVLNSILFLSADIEITQFIRDDNFYMTIGRHLVSVYIGLLIYYLLIVRIPLYERYYS